MGPKIVLKNYLGGFWKYNYSLHLETMIIRVLDIIYFQNICLFHQVSTGLNKTSWEEKS